MLVDRELTKLSKDFPEIEVDRIDVLSHPRQTLKDDIRMIPALKDGDRVLSGILLGNKEIRNFLEEVI